MMPKFMSGNGTDCLPNPMNNQVSLGYVLFLSVLAGQNLNGIVVVYSPSKGTSVSIKPDLSTLRLVYIQRWQNEVQMRLLALSSLARLYSSSLVWNLPPIWAAISLTSRVLPLLSS